MILFVAQGEARQRITPSYSFFLFLKLPPRISAGDYWYDAPHSGIWMVLDQANKEQRQQWLKKPANECHWPELSGFNHKRDKVDEDMSLCHGQCLAAATRFLAREAFLGIYIAFASS